MHFTTIASLAALSATALADFLLYAANEDRSVSGSLYSKHEGAGLNYVFLTSGTGDSFSQDGDHVVSDIANGGPYPYNLGYEGEYLAVGPSVTPETFTFNSGRTLQTGKQFWACKNLGDPYSYSNSEYTIVFGDNAPNDSCVKVSIYKSESSSSSSSAAPSSSVAWNSTVTDHQTVTDYTTYCPELTTFTVTVCDHVCKPKTVTVSEATTLTISSCLVPTTTAAPAPAPAPTTTKSTVAAESTAASVTTFANGGSRLAAGAFAGIAGLALLV